MNVIILLLFSFLANDGPVEFSVVLDDTRIRQGDIVYGEAILKNNSNDELMLNAMSGFYTNILDDRNERFPGNRLISTQAGARFAPRLVQIPRGGKTSRIIAVAPWGIMNRTLDKVVRNELAWPDFTQLGGLVSETNKAIDKRVPDGAIIKISCTVIQPYGRIGRSGERIAPQTHEVEMMVKGAVNTARIKNLYFFPENQLENRKYPPEQRRVGVYDAVDRMSPVSIGSIASVGVAPEFDDPAIIRETLDILDSESRIYRVFKLADMANQWVVSDGVDRLKMEQAMFDYAALGGPIERQYLKEKLEQLFKTKEREQGPFVPRTSAP